MALKRIILEMGTGNDLYGEDYTKAAIRAVQDALHHSSLTLFRTLGLDRDAMQVEITIGVQQPEQINKDEVAMQIPYGSVIVNAELGGLNVADSDNKTVTVIATAAIAARYDLPDGQFML
ncbi:MAG: Lin0512 family protein [Granulosicoccaceae bacterium]